MIISLAHLRGAGNTPSSFFSKVIGWAIQELENNRLQCRIPKLQHLYEKHAKMQYHFRPEFFIQLGGVTEFSFPGQRFDLHAGEMCVVPRGMPHSEVVYATAEPFENMVTSFYRSTIDIHLAHEHPARKPKADDVHFYTSSLQQDLVAYLDRICEFTHLDAKAHATVVRGLLLAVLSLLKNLVDSPHSHLPTATDTVSFCEWLIQHNLQNEELGLEFLCAELSCSPTYLSKLFHRKTGDRLVERIHRLRMQSAIESLRNTRLSIKVISASCGFGDANYFCRTFRKTFRCTPQEYRVKSLERSAQSPTATRRKGANEEDELTVVKSRFDGKVA